MYSINVEIKGITPLLQNRFMQSDLEGKSKKKSGAEMDKETSIKLYLTPDQKIYQPATHLVGCLINAAKSFQIRGKKRATYSKLFGSSINIVPDAIVHKIQDWDEFVTTAVNPNTRGRMIVKRPQLNEWELSFTIQVLDDSIAEDVVKEILDYGGRYVGIGDWRPDKKGKFGQFMVTKFKRE